MDCYCTSFQILGWINTSEWLQAEWFHIHMNNVIDNSLSNLSKFLAGERVVSAPCGGAQLLPCTQHLSIKPVERFFTGKDRRTDVAARSTPTSAVPTWARFKASNIFKRLDERRGFDTNSQTSLF
jgi:putative intracellular protease/amidase